MTNQERYEKYIKENCKNCKNRKSDLCDIRISVIDNVIQTKCQFYERENKLEGYKDKIKMNVTARKGKPIMKGINK